jgi:hypothetical protein
MIHYDHKYNMYDCYDHNSNCKYDHNTYNCYDHNNYYGHIISFARYDHMIIVLANMIIIFTIASYITTMLIMII